MTEAIALARELARFPQTCMRTDRMMAHRQWGMDIAEALTLEAMEGEKPLQEESVKGAARFAAGKGHVVFMGGSIGTILIAMYLPIFTIADTIT